MNLARGQLRHQLSLNKALRKWCQRRCLYTGNGDTDSLEKIESEGLRILNVVENRVKARASLIENGPSNVPSENIARARKLKDLEKLHTSWKDWERSRAALLETKSYLEDSDPAMRELAFEEQTTQLSTLRTMIATTFPQLLVPPSTTATYDALIEFKSGVGGSESSIFLNELVRMYVRFAENRGWKTQVNLGNASDQGGVKDASLGVKGEGCYDELRWESGVHRVQRVPATESSGRIHTSTAAVIVLPVAEQRAINPDEELFDIKDVKIEVMRSRGAGGQHVNKTESAVRLTHEPSGIVISMQDSRSQHQNRTKAFEILRARLLHRKLNEEQLAHRDERRSIFKGADRSEKIRTYNFPQNRVTDHRIGLTVNSIQGMMEGDVLGMFVEELKKRYEEEQLNGLLDESSSSFS